MIPKGLKMKEGVSEVPCLPDHAPPQGESVQCDWVLILKCHFDGFEMRVHGYIYACNGSLDDGSVLQLNHHRLIVELHQEASQLHRDLIDLFQILVPYSYCILRVP